MELTIDQNKCTRCGECFIECPSDSIEHDLKEDSYRIEQAVCIHCSHCALVCPAGAVSTSIGPLPPWNDPKLKPDKLKDFLVGKRSIRRYRSEQLTKELLDDILSVGSLTSTASNTQDWRACVLTQGSVREVGMRIIEFYLRLIKAAENPFLRFILRFTQARPFLRRRRRYRRLIEEYFNGRDRLFFSAPVVVILSAPKRRGHFGMANCILAGQAMMYYAQSLGIGSCMIGFAEIALNRLMDLRSQLGILASHSVGLVFTLGFTDLKFHKLPLRKTIPTQYLERLSSRSREQPSSS
ncbi:MAG TPA: nitroreductase family protein [Spirochaetia bacterium]|nr:nitroreductase family protein [Spirochaetia bacterium]